MSYSLLKIFAFIIFCTTQLLAQKTVKVYYAKEGCFTTDTLNAVSYQIATDSFAINGLFQKYSLPNNKLESSYYMEKGFIEGEYKLFYPNGAIKETTIFNKGNRQSETRWHINGQKAAEFIFGYEKDKRVTTKCVQAWDTLGNLTLDRGEGKYISYADSGYRTEEVYKDSLLEGTTIGYFGDGQIACKDVYEKGKLVSGESWDKAGQRYTYTVKEEMPEFEGGARELHKYLMKNIKYPKEALKKNIKGEIIIQFVIGIDGTITKVCVLKRAGYGFDEEGIRLIKNMPKWKAGKQGGRPVPVRFNLPLRFKLD
jgi:TonB family protein